MCRNTKILSHFIWLLSPKKQDSNNFVCECLKWILAKDQNSSQPIEETILLPLNIYTPIDSQLCIQRQEYCKNNLVLQVTRFYFPYNQAPSSNVFNALTLTHYCPSSLRPEDHSSNAACPLWRQLVLLCIITQQLLVMWVRT